MLASGHESWWDIGEASWRGDRSSAVEVVIGEVCTLQDIGEAPLQNAGDTQRLLTVVIVPRLKWDITIVRVPSSPKLASSSVGMKRLMFARSRFYSD